MFLQAGDLGQYGAGFVLQRRFQECVVGIGNLAGPILEIQITQIFINSLLALVQVSRASCCRANKDSSGKTENVKYTSDGRLWAANNSARGANFCLTLPIKFEAHE